MAQPPVNGSSRFCPACGVPNATTARFCSGCGATFSNNHACTTCGAALKAEAKFCPSCGAQTTSSPIAAPPPHPISTTRRFNKNLTAGAAAAVLVAAAVAIFLVMRGGGDQKAPSGPGVTGKLTLGASVSVAQTTIDAKGGTITVGSNGGPIAGMTVDVPADAFMDRKQFQVSYQPVTGSTFAGLKAVTPIIHIDYGGGYADQPMTVRIPIALQPNEFAMGFYYDDATGTLQGLPLYDIGPDHVTVQAAHFSAIGLFERIAEKAFLLKTVDSGFKPGADDWQFPNTGSYLEPGGNCNGMTVTAMWYYYNQKLANKAAPLYGLYDKNGDKPGTPAIWPDDSKAYRWVSMAQKYSDTSSLANSIDRASGKVARFDDRATYFAIAAAIEYTHGPQLLGIFRNGGGHAILAYRVDQEKIYVADPNHAGDKDRFIELKDGKFLPYSGADKVGGPGYLYDFIRYDGVEALADFGMVAAQWEDFQKGTIGDSDFPAYQLALVETKNGQENWTPLQDGVQTSKQDIIIGVGSATTPNVGVKLFVDGAQYAPAGVNADTFYTKFSLKLKPGQNIVGVWISGAPPGTGGAEYIDFQYVTINYGLEVRITPNPASSQPDKAIAFTATADNLPKQVRWDWDFGDGTKVEDGGLRQSHAYKQEGKYTLKVTLYDATGKAPVVAGAGQAAVTISKEPDALAIIQSTKYLFVAIGGFSAKTVVSGQTVEIPTGSGSMQSGPVTWNGLNFSCAYTDSFLGWKITYSGTVAPDGKSLKTLVVTTVAEAGGAITWHWEFSNVGNPTTGSDPSFGAVWSVNLQGQSAASTFTSGTLTTPDFRAPVVVSSQLPASLTIAFSEKPWSAGVTR